MTDEDLDDIEARRDPDDVPLLVREVRRLRAVAGAAQEFLETCRRFDEADVEKGRRYEEMGAAENEFQAHVGSGSRQAASEKNSARQTGEFGGPARPNG
jgi:hypothetical protein